MLLRIKGLFSKKDKTKENKTQTISSVQASVPDDAVEQITEASDDTIETKEISDSMTETKEPEKKSAPPITNKFIQHLPTEPMIMVINSEALNMFLNTRKKSTEPVMLTESLLMIELPDGAVNLFDIVKNQPADPALADNFSKMYKSLAEKEKSFGLDYIGIGKHCCIAVDKPDQVYVVDTTNLSKLSRYVDYRAV